MCVAHGTGYLAFSKEKKMMKKHLVTVVMLLLVVSFASASSVLKVDFNSTNQDGGPHNQDGWSAYNAGHEVPADFVTADYDGITVTPAWTNTTDNRVQQMIDRTSQATDPATGFDGSWDNANSDLNLITDFLGIDTRTGNGGNGNWDGTEGTPTYLTLTIGGLSAGDYSWTSFHHDTEKVFGTFAVSLSVDGGATFAQLADGLMTNGSGGGNPVSPGLVAGPDAYSLDSTYGAAFTADGVNDIVMQFAPYSANAVHQQIWGINAFEITEIPEPASCLLLLAGMSFMRARRRKA